MIARLAKKINLQNYLMLLASIISIQELVTHSMKNLSQTKHWNSMGQFHTDTYCKDSLSTPVYVGNCIAIAIGALLLMGFSMHEVVVWHPLRNIAFAFCRVCGIQKVAQPLVFGLSMFQI